MKSKIPCLIFFSVISAFVFSKDLRSEAKKEFQACMRETKKDREQCSFGGCGNIIGSCYERQMGAISSATDVLEKKLSATRCFQAEKSVSGEIEGLSSKLKALAPFDGTWSGYNAQLEVALLKNSVMNLLAKECEANN
jgi:hypothetical protein